jgi:hypothetical protein
LFRSGIMLDPQKENILLLGMVFSDQLAPTRGQEFRDRARCIQLQRLGFNVCTVDDKHKDDYLFPGLHCNANFNQARGFISQIRGKWGNDVKFSHVILDYFFSPVSWARERWSPKFFSETIPAIATNILTPGGKLWLPSLENVTAAIYLNHARINSFFTVHEVEDPMKHPLYVATENATVELLSCPDNYTNENQILPLLVYHKFPFYALELTRSEESMDYECEYNKFSTTEIMWDTISLAPPLSDGPRLVRVFSGGRQSTQSGPFFAALKGFQRRVGARALRIEVMDTSMLCRFKWAPKQFVDWLLQSNIHFILAHVHQSLLLHNLMWDMREALSHFQRLKYHTGFPTGDQLRCPVFTQDKIVYLKCLGDLANNTLTVPLTEDGEFTNTCLESVKR